MWQSIDALAKIWSDGDLANYHDTEKQANVKK